MTRSRWASRQRAPAPRTRRSALASDAESRALSTLGLARRGGHVVIGSRAVREALGAGDVHAVVVARDATDNALDRLSGALERFPSAARWCGSKAEIGSALGRGPVVAVAITDEGLARAVAGELEDVGESARSDRAATWQAAQEQEGA